MCLMNVTIVISSHTEFYIRFLILCGNLKKYKINLKSVQNKGFGSQ